MQRRTPDNNAALALLDMANAPKAAAKETSVPFPGYVPTAVAFNVESLPKTVRGFGKGIQEQFSQAIGNTKGATLHRAWVIAQWKQQFQKNPRKYEWVHFAAFSCHVSLWFVRALVRELIIHTHTGVNSDKTVADWMRGYLALGKLLTQDKEGVIWKTWQRVNWPQKAFVDARLNKIEDYETAANVFLAQPEENRPSRMKGRDIRAYAYGQQEGQVENDDSKAEKQDNSMQVDVPGAVQVSGDDLTAQALVKLSRQAQEEKRKRQEQNLEEERLKREDDRKRLQAVQAPVQIDPPEKEKKTKPADQQSVLPMQSDPPEEGKGEKSPAQNRPVAAQTKPMTSGKKPCHKRQREEEASVPNKQQKTQSAASPIIRKDPVALQLIEVCRATDEEFKQWEAGSSREAILIMRGARAMFQKWKADNEELRKSLELAADFIDSDDKVDKDRVVQFLREMATPWL